MSINLEIIFGHNLDSDRIANLPTLLNRYFAPHLKNIQLRLDRGYLWDMSKTPSGGLKWVESCCDGDIEGRNLLGIEEDSWEWCYEGDEESFEEWFQNQKSLGCIPLNGYAGMMLFVGEKTVCLGTDIRWHHFLLDLPIQEDLSEFISYLLDFFNSNCRSVMYTAGGCGIAGAILDEYIGRGWSIEQIISDLSKIQLPVKSIKDMMASINDDDDEIESFKYDNYYVENLYCDRN